MRKTKVSIERMIDKLTGEPDDDEFLRLWEKANREFNIMDDFERKKAFPLEVRERAAELMNRVETFAYDWIEAHGRFPEKPGDKIPWATGYLRGPKKLASYFLEQPKRPPRESPVIVVEVRPGSKAKPAARNGLVVEELPLKG